MGTYWFLCVFTSWWCLIIAYINCRIWYDEKGFLYKSFFGIRRRFTYDQVTAIKENTHETFIYVGKKRLIIDEFAIGRKDFINLVRKKYRTLHNGETLPKIIKTKHDIFKGNIKDTGGFIFAYSLISLILIGVLGVVVYITYFNTVSESNTDKHTISIVSCENSSRDILFASSDNQLYKIRYADELIDIKDILPLCDGVEVTVYSTEAAPDNDENYHSVKAIEFNGKYILSFDETNKVHRDENQPAVIIVGTFCLFWAVFVTVSIYVGRNPHKFSKKFVRLFFKDGYVLSGRK